MSIKWKVIVTRDTSESVYVEVEADTMEEANEKALGRVNSDDPVNFEWELDEGASRPYIGDPDGAERVAG